MSPTGLVLIYAGTQSFQRGGLGSTQIIFILYPLIFIGMLQTAENYDGNISKNILMKDCRVANRPLKTSVQGQKPHNIKSNGRTGPTELGVGLLLA